MSESARGFAHILAVIIILLGIILAVRLVLGQTSIKSKASFEGVTLSVQPSTVNATSGGDFQVNIFADSSNLSTAAVELHVGFDPNTMDYKGLSNGTFLSQILVPVSVGKGEISITYSATPGSGDKGTGILTTITFSAKQNFIGSTTIYILDSTQVATLDSSGNALGSTFPSSVVINSPPPSKSPSPSLSPLPTLSPNPSPTSTASATLVSPKEVSTSATIVATASASKPPSQPSPTHTIISSFSPSVHPLPVVSYPTLSPQSNVSTGQTKTSIPILGGIINFLSRLLRR